MDLSGSEKYKGQYRVPSARLQTWDYGWNGAYFITICTKDRTNYFGEIIDRKMRLSHMGILADVFWYEIKNHTKNIELGDFVVMPNHVHGILLLNRNKYDDDKNHSHQHSRDKACLVSIDINTTVHQTIGQQRFQNQGKNTISSIIGGYKSAVTKHAHRLGYEFAWQPRFHDHIIRDDESYNRIAKYVINNPQNWQDDKFYTDNKS